MSERGFYELSKREQIAWLSEDANNRLSEVAELGHQIERLTTTVTEAIPRIDGVVLRTAEAHARIDSLYNRVSRLDAGIAERLTALENVPSVGPSFANVHDELEDLHNRLTALEYAPRAGDDQVRGLDLNVLCETCQHENGDHYRTRNKCAIPGCTCSWFVAPTPEADAICACGHSKGWHTGIGGNAINCRCGGCLCPAFSPMPEAAAAQPVDPMPTYEITIGELNAIRHIAHHLDGYKAPEQVNDAVWNASDILKGIVARFKS